MNPFAQLDYAPAPGPRRRWLRALAATATALGAGLLLVAGWVYYPSLAFRADYLMLQRRVFAMHTRAPGEPPRPVFVRDGSRNEFFPEEGRWVDRDDLRRFLLLSSDLPRPLVMHADALTVEVDGRRYLLVVVHDGWIIGSTLKRLIPERRPWERLDPVAFPTGWSGWLRPSAFDTSPEGEWYGKEWTLYSVQPDPEDATLFHFAYDVDGHGGKVIYEILDPESWVGFRLRQVTGILAPPARPHSTQPSPPAENPSARTR